MRFTALGLAAIAIAVQTIRWIIAKTDIENEDDSPPPSPTKDQVSLSHCISADFLIALDVAIIVASQILVWRARLTL